ncbi:hypothetical protein PGB90_009528 [Kerria lacca]
MDVLVENALRKYFAENLASKGKTKYLNFEPDDGAKGVDGRTSDYLSGKIRYEKDGEVCTTQSLFLKLMKDSKSSQMSKIEIPKGFFTATFNNEVLFYSVMKPFLDTFKPMDNLLPKFHNIQMDITVNVNNGALLLDNLRNSEFVPCKQSDIEYNHLVLLMRKLGEFHAYSFYAKKKHPSQFFILGGFFTEAHCLDPPLYKIWLRQRMEVALKPLENDSQYSAGLSKIKQLTEDIEGILSQHFKVDKTSETTVLAHRACRSENILFSYKNGKPNDLKLLDWQTCKLNYLGIDILLILYLEASQQIRNEKWNNLIDEYYVGLSQTFTDNVIPSKEAIHKEVINRIPSIIIMFGQKYYKKEKNENCDPITEIVKDMINRM